MIEPLRGKKGILLGCGVVAGLVLIAALVVMLSGNQNATKQWEAAVDTDTIPAYQSFLESHPEADEVPLATSRIEVLRERELFYEAVILDTRSAYGTYLEEYPTGEYVDDANARREYILAADTTIRRLSGHWERFAANVAQKNTHAKSLSKSSRESFRALVALAPLADANDAIEYWRMGHSGIGVRFRMNDRGRVDSSRLSKDEKLWIARDFALAESAREKGAHVDVQQDGWGRGILIARTYKGVLAVSAGWDGRYETGDDLLWQEGRLVATDADTAELPMHGSMESYLRLRERALAELSRIRIERQSPGQGGSREDGSVSQDAETAELPMDGSLESYFRLREWAEAELSKNRTERQSPGQGGSRRDEFVPLDLIGLKGLEILEAPEKPGGLAKKVRDPKTEITFILVEPGKFMMGSSSGEGGDSERPQHEVRIARPFYLAETELTQAQWEGLMGGNPSGFKGANKPVDRVSWEGAKEFMEAAGPGYRLPSEAEWEYACRAGSTTTWCFGDSEGTLSQYAWYGEDSHGGSAQDVGQKKPNAWGFFDMHGNVWEWCADEYHDTYEGAPSDGSAWVPGFAFRLIRGGSFFNTAVFTRSAERAVERPSEANRGVGLRPAIGISPD